MSQPVKQNLYRKYRPQSFTELLGQDHIVKTIQAAISQGRVSHAYLFSGPRGTGKTSMARLLAKILNCGSPVTTPAGLRDACRQCTFCRRVEDLTFMDIIEIDAASNNSVDDIRDMREKVKYLPVEGQYKVYIIDEVHMLSGAAFNAFLKTLEEPPPRVVFILATTDPQKPPSTIISRCQCFDFHSVSAKVITERLQEVVRRERENDPHGFPEVPVDVLHVIAETVDGGFRDALSLLDQISSSHLGGTVSLDTVLEMTKRVGFKTLYDLSSALLQKNAGDVIVQVNDLFFRGHEVSSLGKDLLEYFRRGLLLRIDEKAERVLQIPREQVQQLQAQMKDVPLEFLMALVSKLERTLSALRQSIHPRLLFEIELTRIAQREISLGLEGVERRLKQLEEASRSPTVVIRKPGAGEPAMKTPVSRPVVAPGPAGEVKIPVRGAPVASEPMALWRQFQETVAQEKGIWAGYFHNSRVESFKDQVLTVVTESDFAARQANDLRTQEGIKPLFISVFGPAVRLLIRGPGQKEEAKASSPAEKPSVKQSIERIDQEEKKKILEKPSVSDALKIFGGEITSIEK